MNNTTNIKAMVVVVVDEAEGVRRAGTLTAAWGIGERRTLELAVAMAVVAVAGRGPLLSTRSLQVF